MVRDSQCAGEGVGQEGTRGTSGGSEDVSCGKDPCGGGGQAVLSESRNGNAHGERGGRRFSVGIGLCDWEGPEVPPAAVTHTINNILPAIWSR